MIWFTSDWHLGESRLGDIKKGEFNPHFRPFKTTEEQDRTIIDNINADVAEKDVMYVIGDVAVTDEAVALLGEIKCKNMVLIQGNYDEPRLELLEPYFNNMLRATYTVALFDFPVNMTHCPVDCDPSHFNIVGHIHDLWKVKRNMVNVSVDAWHFKPVSKPEIEFVKGGIDNYYDENVFYGEEK